MTEDATDPRALWLHLGRRRLDEALEAKIPEGGHAVPLPTEPGRDVAAGPDTDRDADHATAYPPAANPLERRTNSDRRVVYDRRQMIRFEDDRRVAVERRAGDEALDIA